MTERRPETHGEIEAELTKIESLISTAVRLVGEGRLVDLSALERRTLHACDAAVALPSDESRSLLPVMERLIGSLDELTERLTVEFGDLPKLQGEAAPITAASAYHDTQTKSG